VRHLPWPIDLFVDAHPPPVRLIASCVASIDRAGSRASGQRGKKGLQAHTSTHVDGAFLLCD
jgi:hypothetical protein